MTPREKNETARQRFGRLLEERQAELGMEWGEIARIAGVTRQNLLDIRNGRVENPRPKTKRGLERAVGWLPGSIDNTLNGGDPEIAPYTTHSTFPALGVATEPAGDAGPDLIVRLADGTMFLVEVKMVRGEEVWLREFAEMVRQWADVHNGSVLTDQAVEPTIPTTERTVREIEDDPDLPPDVKRQFIERYRRLREETAEAAEAARQRRSGG